MKTHLQFQMKNLQIIPIIPIIPILQTILLVKVANLQQQVSQINFLWKDSLIFLKSAYLISNSCLILLTFIDVCLTLPCGVNAKCETADGEYSCTCPENMEGDPKMKCEGIYIYIHYFGLH